MSKTYKHVKHIKAWYNFILTYHHFDILVVSLYNKRKTKYL